MHLVKMTMKWPSSMIGRGPKMFRYKIHWKLTIKNKKAVEMPTIETKQVVNTPNNQS